MSAEAKSYAAGARNQYARQLTETWLTPKWFIDALGPFDTDAACPGQMPWRTAARMITKAEDSLSMDWKALGYTWCNPPWGTAQWEFVDRMAGARNGMCLIRARTSTRKFHTYALSPGEKRCDAVVWLSGGRLAFHAEDGTRNENGDAWPHVLLLWGETAIRNARRALGSREIQGTLVVYADPGRQEPGGIESSLEKRPKPGRQGRNQQHKTS